MQAINICILFSVNLMLQSTGSISVSQINTELGNTTTSQFSFGSAESRILANKASGPISASNMYSRMPTNHFIVTPVQLSGTQWGINVGSGKVSAGTFNGYGIYWLIWQVDGIYGPVLILALPGTGIPQATVNGINLPSSVGNLGAPSSYQDSYLGGTQWRFTCSTNPFTLIGLGVPQEIILS